MTPTELLGFVCRALERIGIPYAVVGSVASSFYGDARMTNDIDFLAQMDESHIGPVLASFPTDDFYVSEDAIRQALRHHSQFNIIHPTSGLKIDIMTPGSGPYDRLQLSRRRLVKPTSTDFEAYFAAPEDVILKKLEYYREGGSDKHLRDIAGMLKSGNDPIDLAYIEGWAERLGVIDVWQAVLSRVQGRRS